ncbi:MAG: ABC transporter substrate-binding protein [Streptosporangiaceae bacterium]
MLMEGKHMGKARIGAASVIAAVALLAAACGSATNSSAPSSAPADITVGTLYSGSGSFATSSQPQLAGLKFWISQENAKGGAYVGAYHKRIPLKLVTYNDQSSASTAAVQYNQLVTQDKVNILVADFGSVLTAPAVTIAQEHKTLLFDPTGTGASFFTPGNRYIVLTSLPTSAIWPNPLVAFIKHEHISRVAIVYGSNDFDASQAATTRSGLIKDGITPLVYEAVPTSTTSYGTIISTVAAKKVQAFLEFGYATNDIPFLQNLQASGDHFGMVFTAFPGQLHALIEQNVGAKGLSYTFSYGFPPQLAFTKVTAGMTTSQFLASFGGTSSSPVNFLDVAGYNTGLVIQQALAHASSLSQTALRDAVASVSGKLDTIDGAFRINSEGAQIGELLPVSQMIPATGGTSTKIGIVFPAGQANTAAKYPAP